MIKIFSDTKRNPEKTNIRIAVDVKNLALFASGISGFFTPILVSWIQARPEIEFLLVGPSFINDTLAELKNCQLINIAWPESLPRTLRHPIYDNFLFPNAISKLKPDFVFSPYHDVRLPRNIPSVMMIHDTCIGDLPRIYPSKVRLYYQAMLRVNLRRAKAVLTVSEASKSAILQRYKLSGDSVHVVYNTLDRMFFEDDLNENSKQLRRENGLNMFYTGGNEYRKNISRLLDAISNLLDNGYEPWLWVTGSYSEAWQVSLNGRSPLVIERIKFLGRLSLGELRAQYLTADVVVYPSLCEGFGRACLEAMVLGVPIACSNLPVFVEVSGKYPVYFDPLDVNSISNAIVMAATQGRRERHSDARFELNTVKQHFIKSMDDILLKEFKGR